MLDDPVGRRGDRVGTTGHGGRRASAAPAAATGRGDCDENHEQPAQLLHHGSVVAFAASLFAVRLASEALHEELIEHETAVK